MPNVANDYRPAFLITVDTEGDDPWSQPATITTENARFLPRFQSLCEKYGFKPTWLTNYEMAESSAFTDFARDLLNRGTGEVGMHLHAWNSPPIVPLTENDYHHQPYLNEYPEKVVRDKIHFMTELLENRFQRKMLSHRAGRWGLNAVYARLLVENGYRVDCTVTPHTTWANYPGDPNGPGGTDFRSFPDTPYFMDLDRIDRPGDSPLLEVPVSIVKTRFFCGGASSDFVPSVVCRAVRRFLPPTLELVPRDRKYSLRRMRKILSVAAARRWPCVVLATHSCELMPGGSPFFPNEAAIERLYKNLEILFSAAVQYFKGMTLEGFYREYSNDTKRGKA